jgi:DNA repair protein RecO (recombination protein O)
MSQVYKATGIILKGMPLGEADRLVTILTAEFGLVRSVVPGARKHKSKLGGKSDLFVVNEFLIVKGRSLDKIIQAETLQTYSGLSRDLLKLAAAQYLAELSLSLALREQPQQELYALLREHLERIEKLPSKDNTYAHLAQAAFHLLALAGIAPQVYNCCLTQQQLEANFGDPSWEVGFSFDSGGVIEMAATMAGEMSFAPGVPLGISDSQASPPKIHSRIGAVELSLLQQLGLKVLPQPSEFLPTDFSSLCVEDAWAKIERILRDYAQYQVGHTFRSAQFIDNLLGEFVFP